MSPPSVVVLASGRGRTFEALLEHSRAGSHWQVAALLVDRPQVPAAELAGARGCPVHVVDPSDPGPILDHLAPDLVLLAGYLRLVPASVTRRFRGRMLNVHPSLLPAFGGRGMHGQRVHEAVISAGVRVTGTTVHLVNERFDEGAIVAQWPVAVMPGDTPDLLARRVQAVEKRLYPRVVDHAARAIGAGAPIVPLASVGLPDGPDTDNLAPDAPGASVPIDSSSPTTTHDTP